MIIRVYRHAVAMVSMILILVALALPARAQDQIPDPLRQTGRRLAEELGGAIINVRVVVNQQMSWDGGASPERESQSETNGTVISPDGLTLVPLSAVDPAQFLRKSLSSSASSQMSFSSRVKDIKLIVNKRDEIRATVVLRDNDLNIAFLRPTKKPAGPMKFIDLGADADGQMLDRVMVLARLGRVADREIAVMTGEIQATISKPRKFYVPSGELSSGGMGVPIFNAAGRLIGVVLARTAPGGNDRASFGGQTNSNTLMIILPARDVKEIADQAPKEAIPTPEVTPATHAEPTTKTVTQEKPAKEAAQRGQE